MVPWYGSIFNPRMGDPDAPVVVVGAGVVGVLQAYYLARAGAKVVLIDAFGVGSGLSGAASGYVPMNCYPCDGAMGSLARTSFHLQFKLADELDGAHNYDYRRMSVLAFDPPTSAGAVTGVRSMKRSGSTDSDSGKRHTLESRELLPPWADGHAIGKVSVLDTPFGTAQLNPERFYDTVVKAAVGLGCELVLGSPVEAVLWDGPRAVGVRLGSGREIASRAIVMATGYFTTLMRAMLRADTMVPMTIVRSHYAVLSPRCRPPTATPAGGCAGAGAACGPPGSASTASSSSAADPCAPSYTRGSAPPSGSPQATPGLVTSTALFKRGGGLFAGMEQPKLFPRPSGDVYVVGFADPLPRLPPLVDAAPVSHAIVEKLVEFARGCSSWLADDKYAVSRSGAVYAALTEDGMPLVGPVDDVEGLYISSGHTFGLLMATGSGLALTELILEGEAKSVDISPFRPRRPVTAMSMSYVPLSSNYSMV